MLRIVSLIAVEVTLARSPFRLSHLDVAQLFLLPSLKQYPPYVSLMPLQLLSPGRQFTIQYVLRIIKILLFCNFVQEGLCRLQHWFLFNKCDTDEKSHGHLRACSPYGPM